MPETKIASKVRQYIRQELRGVYTVSFCVVEEVKYKDMEVKVSLKRDKEAIFTVPIASVFAQPEGYGLVVPIEPGNEGIVLHTKAPIDDLTVETGHVEYSEPKRIFDINDGLFFPMYWNDNDKKPDSNFDGLKQGDWLLSHKSGTIFQIKGEEHGAEKGGVVVQTESGVGIRLDNNTGTFKLRESSGYGIKGDGSGNFTWHAKDVNMTNSTFEL